MNEKTADNCTSYDHNLWINFIHFRRKGLLIAFKFQPLLGDIVFDHRIRRRHPSSACLMIPEFLGAWHLWRNDSKYLPPRKMGRWHVPGQKAGRKTSVSQCAARSYVFKTGQINIFCIERSLSMLISGSRIIIGRFESPLKGI